MLERTIKELGGDPTVLTPSANLAVNISAGLPQVLTDPRTTLLQSLEAVVVAELADNECWATLEELAWQAGQEELAGRCRSAIANEREHLRNVRLWIASGQGRAATQDGRAEMPASGGTATDERGAFTCSENSPVDREGYVLSEEEAVEGDAGGDPARRSGNDRTPRRRR
jgi:hypothetical protein